MFGFLAACVSVGPVDDGSGTGQAQGEAEFIVYGEAVHAAPQSDRSAFFYSALSEHEAAQSADSAIRLAIARLAVENYSPSAETLSLLAFAESSAATEGARAFLEFFRPLVERLADQHATIELETEARQALEAQLEALKALEEQLDAPGAGR